jgi:outer membrane protein OmpA-like peptidoglycan-associated protein
MIRLFFVLFVSSMLCAQNDCKKSFRKISSIEKKITKGEKREAKLALDNFNFKCTEFLYYVSIADMYFYLKEYKSAYIYYSNAYNVYGTIQFQQNSLYNFLFSSYNSGYYERFDIVLNSLNLDLDQNTYIQDLINKNNFAIAHKSDSVEFNPIPLSINSDADEYFPSMPINSDLIIYTYRDQNSILKDEDFFISRKKDNIWMDPVRLGDNINSDYREGSLSISLDGRDLFFASCNRPDSYGGCDLYWSTLISDTVWSEAYNMGELINTKYWESQPSISSDGKTIFFASNRYGGYGGSDIWMSKIHNGIWSNPINLGPLVNSPLDEYTPFIHFDNKTFYFASKGKDGFGGFDLFVSKIDSLGMILNVKNLGYPINTHNDESGLIVAFNGKTAYYNTLINNQLDIFSFTLPYIAEASPVAIINGFVLDSISKLGISDANLTISGLDQSFEYSIYTKQNGYFSFTIPLEAKFNLTILSTRYDFLSKNDSIKKGQDRKNINLVLNRLRVGNKINLNNVYYKFDDYSLDSSSLIELKNFAIYLIRNTFLNIEIGGHTDNIGSDNYNNKLSTKRAKSVYDALISFGVSFRQLQYRGYGYQFPIIDNDSDEARLQNRRTEIKIMDE